MNVSVLRQMGFVVTAFVLSASGVLAHQDDRVQIDVVQSGIYQSSSGAAGEGPDLLAATTIVPAALGREFGFEFDARGVEAGNPVELTLVTEFPAQGLYDPETQKTIFTDERPFRSVQGFRGYQGYSLDSASELVLGTWTFKIMHHDQVLATQSFVLVSP